MKINESEIPEFERKLNACFEGLVEMRLAALSRFDVSPEARETIALKIFVEQYKTRRALYFGEKEDEIEYALTPHPYHGKHRTNIFVADMCMNAVAQEGSLIAVYFPFDGSAGHHEINYIPFCIPLLMDRYSTADREIELNPENPHKAFEQRDAKHIHEELRAHYLKLAVPGKANLIEVVDGVSRIAKGSIAFNVDSFLKDGEVTGLEPAARERVIEKARAYRPSQYATKTGLCDKEGHTFRTLLYHVGLPSHIKYHTLQCHRPIEGSSHTISHDLTMIIDAKTRTWYVVNSLSTALEIDTVHKEELALVGRMR